MHSPLTDTIDIIAPGANLNALRTLIAPLGSRDIQVAILQATDLDPEAIKGARALFAYAPFRCGAPLPEIQSLFLGDQASIDRRTAACFPRLENLRVESRQTINLGWFDGSRLRGLAMNDWSVTDWEVVRSTGIERLSLAWSQARLEYLPAGLQTLSLTRWGNLSNDQLRPIWALPALQSLRLVNVDLPSLSAMGQLATLKELLVHTARSFKGVERMRNLESLEFIANKCPPIAFLTRSASSLRQLILKARVPPEDLTSLAELTKLQSLEMTFGDIHHLEAIHSLAFLRHLGHLRELKLLGVKLPEASAAIIDGLPSLQVLELSGQFGPAVRGLTRHRHGRRTTVHLVGTERQSRASLPKPRLVDGMWTLFDDLSLTLGMQSNYEVAEAVERKLKLDAPEVAGRVVLDTEAESFCARARSLADLKRVLAVIVSMRNKVSNRPLRRRRSGTRD